MKEPTKIDVPTKSIFFDLDETLCKTPEDRDYSKATPYQDRIGVVNRLYDRGYHITVYTARGSLSGVDYTELTKKQLDSWGLKYHEVKCTKPFYNLFVCDRTINSETFFEPKITDSYELSVDSHKILSEVGDILLESIVENDIYAKYVAEQTNTAFDIASEEETIELLNQWGEISGGK